MAYRLTNRAAENIIDAYLFGLERFGAIEADAYRDSLVVHHHGRHYVIYRIEPSDNVLILAVLHDAMDLAQHLERART